MALFGILDSEKGTFFCPELGHFVCTESVRQLGIEMQ